MLATGGSVCEMIRVYGLNSRTTLQLLKEHGIPENHIIFLNVISAPQGIERVFSQYPDVRIVTCAVDEGLNDEKFIVPVELLQKFKNRVWAIMGIVTSILPTNGTNTKNRIWSYMCV